MARDSARIHGYQGRIDDLRARLGALQASLAAERSQLLGLRSELASARAHVTLLSTRFATDRQVLASQLVADYESPSPDLVTVVLNAKGFAQLLERLDFLRRIERHNLHLTLAIRRERLVIAREESQLGVMEARQRQITTAVQIQRNQTAEIKLAVVSKQLIYVRARAHKGRRLRALQARQRRLARALAATGSATAGSGGLPAFAGAGLSGGTGATFGAHGGQYGFFPAAGTNYSVGDEPQLAARLDQLGQSLSLHLIGISGYRSPQHSVEVGGFANDPHTRGQASDTPGVEGVPEAVLQRFGLTRPFPGAAEADHIQLAGSI